jgi:class 3 adenylate cyclase
MTSPGADPAGAIVFTDIVGFTELTDLQGDDVALAVVERQVELVRQVLPPRARIVKELGDGLLLWFDDPVEAVDAALELLARFECESVDGMPLWIRIGMHWGAPRRRGDDIIGRDVNLASRVAGVAGTGEAICTEQLVAAVGGADALHQAAFESLGSVFVKGFADAVAVATVHPTGLQPAIRPADRTTEQEASCASAE